MLLFTFNATSCLSSDAATAALNTGFVSGSATINLYSQSKISSKVVVEIKKSE